MIIQQAYYRSSLCNMANPVPRFPVFPVKTTYFYIAYMSRNVSVNNLERHTPYKYIYSTGNREQYLETLDIKGSNTFPLCFLEWEHAKKGEHHEVKA